MDRETEAPASFEFGRFKILPQHRDVLADGRPLRLGGRAFDVPWRSSRPMAPLSAKTS
jgi:hypothetical protein